MKRDTVALMVASSPSTSVAWAPGTGLVDMPNEILREIFISIDGEFSKTLWSLCLTCKLFRNVVEEHCEPEYNLRGKYIEDPYALMEQIKARPELRSLIRVACMERDFVEFTKHMEEDVLALVSALNLESIRDVMYREFYEELSWENGGPVWLTLLLPHIETIELVTKKPDTERIHIPITTVLQDPHNTNCLRSHRFDRLRNLVLAHSAQNSIVLCPIDRVYLSNFMLPSLKVAKLHNVIFDGDEWPEGHSGCSSVTELHIHDDQDAFVYPDLSGYLDTFKTLEILHLYIHNSYVLYIEDYLERPRYIEILVSHAQSLQDLQLYSCERYYKSDGSFMEMSPHCPPQPSLGHFTNLKSLALTDMSLVGMSTAGPAHWYQSIETTLNHLAKMFPPSLETFKHLLWDGPSVFAKALTKRQQPLRSWERIWKASDQNQFPSLQKVLTQNYDIDVLSSESTVIWERSN